MVKKTFVQKYFLLRPFILSLLPGFTILATLSPLHANEEEDEDMYTGSVRIESKTELNSAQCIIDGGDQNEDRKRKDLGSGEKVWIKLKGKPALVGKTSSIKWSIDADSKKYVEFEEENSQGKRTVELTVKKHLPNAAGAVNIQVKTDALEEPMTIKFTAYRPQVNFDVKNTKSPIKGYTDNGDTNNFGASTKLELTVKRLVSVSRTLESRKLTKTRDHPTLHKVFGHIITRDWE